MTCGKIPESVLRNARTLEDVYTSWGVLKPKNGQDAGSAAALPPPRTFLPEGMDRAAFSYLTGNDGRTFNLAPLFADNRAKYNCVLASLGYDEEKAKKLSTDSSELDDAAYAKFEAELPPADALTFNIYKTLQVLEYMRKEGNTDRQADLIVADEIENWAWERTGHNQQSYAKFGGDAIARLHALLGLSEQLAVAQAEVRAPEAPKPAPGFFERFHAEIEQMRKGFPNLFSHSSNDHGLSLSDLNWKDGLILGGTGLFLLGTGALLGRWLSSAPAQAKPTPPPLPTAPVPVSAAGYESIISNIEGQSPAGEVKNTSPQTVEQKVVVEVNLPPNPAAGPLPKVEASNGLGAPNAWNRDPKDPAKPVLTKEHFAEIIHARYPELIKSLDDPAELLEIADEIRKAWEADANPPTVQIDGHVYPDVRFIDEGLKAIAQKAQQGNGSSAAAFHAAYEAGRANAEGRGLEHEGVSQPLREAGRRMFEAMPR